MTIVGEHDFAVRAHLIGASRARAERDRRRCSPIPSHSPSAPASCASTCPAVELRSVSSTADGGAHGRRVGPALGGDRRPLPPPSSTAARSCARGSRTRPTTSPASSGSPRREPSRQAVTPGRPRSSSPSWAKTTPAPWSRPCSEFSSRGVNLSRIESRPLRSGLGRYMFFCDLEGSTPTTLWPRRSRRCAARPNRCESWAPTQRLRPRA